MAKISVKLIQVNFGHPSLEPRDATTLVLINYIIDGTPRTLPSLSIGVHSMVPHHPHLERIPLQATAEIGKERIAIKNHS